MILRSSGSGRGARSTWDRYPFFTLFVGLFLRGSRFLCIGVSTAAVGCREACGGTGRGAGPDHDRDCPWFEFGLLKERKRRPAECFVDKCSVKGLVRA